ncbi:unnamed protein product [Arabis nemorensis]|uniref:Uncharacterized protein n=1 Tax=Arabis nemorensis TaxID=586526 RepID=A0A565C0K0_9BRAS|nr:unnamed protein product [Arabis nemorensis]
MGISSQSSVWQAYFAKDWQIPSRSRNGMIRNVCALLRDSNPPDISRGSDIYYCSELFNEYNLGHNKATRAEEKLD